MDKIIIYTDGGARGNGSDDAIGGWGALLQYRDHVKEIYGGDKGVTNNQMELTGAIKALEVLKTTDIPIHIHCDSAYVINGMNKWIAGWKRKGWKKGDGKKPENLELWKRLDELSSRQKDVKWKKVKGHADDEGNNRADELVNVAMDEIEASL